MNNYQAYETIIRLLREKAIPFTLHEHEVARTVAEAEERLPFPKEQFLKTVVFRIKNAGWVLVGARGHESIDYRKLAAAFGVKRGDVVRASAEEIEGQLGYEIGGVCPIPLEDGVQAVIDSGTTAMDVVFCGTGRNDRTLEIRLQDLLRLTQARVLPLVRERQEV
jgi:Cys-tRNA(Pro)/Cys-tRNA(Cys) deacylase